MLKKQNNYKRPYLIAEIGINHNGSLKIAKKMIDAAHSSGFNAVKFQKRDPDICVPENQKKILRETPWGQISYLAYKKKIEFNVGHFIKLKNYAKKLKLDFSASCFDIESYKLMNKLNDFNKIPSAMITNINFLEEVAKKRKKTLISTGMCTIKDIYAAVKIFKKHKCKYELMHCVSLYPCPENKLNLRMIQTLKNKFKCKVGYSGHESSVTPSLFAYMFGAETIERHITLDRSMWGTDQAASLSPDGMNLLCTSFDKIQDIIGDGIKKFSNEEKKMLKKFKYW